MQPEAQASWKTGELHGGVHAQKPEETNDIKQQPKLSILQESFHL